MMQLAPYTLIFFAIVPAPIFVVEYIANRRACDDS